MYTQQQGSEPTSALVCSPSWLGLWLSFPFNYFAILEACLLHLFEWGNFILKYIGSTQDYEPFLKVPKSRLSMWALIGQLSEAAHDLHSTGSQVAL